MCSYRNSTHVFLATALALTYTVTVMAQPKENAAPPGVIQILQGRKNPVIPGGVQLNNGLVLYGLCDNARTIDADLPQDRRLELRRINQQFRTYFVATRKSVAPSQNELALPKDDYRILQRRTSQRPLNYELGMHARTPFDPDGQSQVKLQLRDNKTVEIKLGITAINSNRVQVDGLTHQWRFGMSLATIPESTLYAGTETPSLLKKIKGFENGEMQINLAEMLQQGKKYAAARQLLSDAKDRFPNLQERCERLTEKWNERVGTQALIELAALRDTGKPELARAYAHQWPEQKLADKVRIRAKQFLESLDDDSQRLSLARQAINAIVSQIEDEKLRDQAMRIVRETDREFDLNTLDRITPFELLRMDDTLSPEGKLALAASGMIMGGDAAIDNFPEAAGLIHIRSLLRDYLNTDDDESALRNELLEDIRAQEGFSVERVGLLLEHLLPPIPISVTDTGIKSPGTFRIAADENIAGCVGIVPREYAATRRYPVIIAFPREGLTLDETLSWWQSSADRHGYIVVVPELYDDHTFRYDASAPQHLSFLNLLRKLKTGLSVDDDRIFVAGHGIGGEAAMDIGTAHPDLFAGVVSFSGLGRTHLKKTAQNSADLAWYIVVGSKHRGWTTRLKPIVERLFKRHDVRGRMLYNDVLFARYDDRGFESYAEELPNLFLWLNLQRRRGLPDRIDAAVMRSTDSSWFWLGLSEVSDRSRSLEKPTTWQHVPTSNMSVAGEINGAGNLIRLTSLPGNAIVRLSPNLPEIDLAKPITIRNVRGRDEKVDYVPSTRDLLDDFRDRRDRKRLCFMKVPLTR